MSEIRIGQYGVRLYGSGAMEIVLLRRMRLEKTITGQSWSETMVEPGPEQEELVVCMNREEVDELRRALLNQLADHAEKVTALKPDPPGHFDPGEYSSVI